MQYLEFEKPIAELQAKIDALRQISASDQTLNIGTELAELQKKNKKLTEQVFSKLSDWQIIQVARHPDRPYTLDYYNRDYGNGKFRNSIFWTVLWYYKSF